MADYARVSAEVAQRFVTNPADFVTGTDLRFDLARRLYDRVEPPTSTVADSPLPETSEEPFKRNYWRAIRDKLEERGELSRVHADVSASEGGPFDVVVFEPRIGSIDWVSHGSKRFRERDLEAAFELTFVERKFAFPKHVGDDTLDTNVPSVEEILARTGSSDPILDFEENELRSDLRELNRLDDVEHRFLLLFSTNNYLYQNPGARETDESRRGELYRRLGTAARAWLDDHAAPGVGILYAHPRGLAWVSDPAGDRDRERDRNERNEN